MIGEGRSALRFGPVVKRRLTPWLRRARRLKQRQQGLKRWIVLLRMRKNRTVGMPQRQGARAGGHKFAAVKQRRRQGHLPQDNPQAGARRAKGKPGGPDPQAVGHLQIDSFAPGCGEPLRPIGQRGSPSCC